MAEQRSSQPSIMSHFLLNWNFESLQAADKEMFDDDDESELSDGMSMQSSMDLDMKPFESDSTSNSKSNGFSVQHLLPLEVR